MLKNDNTKEMVIAYHNEKIAELSEDKALWREILNFVPEKDKQEVIGLIVKIEMAQHWTGWHERAISDLKN